MIGRWDSMVDRPFQVLHALRVRGVATPGYLAGMVGLDAAAVRVELDGLTASGFGRTLARGESWQLTPDGRAAHAQRLDEWRAATPGVIDALRACYEQQFVALDGEVKAVCGRWQLRSVGGTSVPNDHADPAWDGCVHRDLSSAHERAMAFCSEPAGEHPPLRRYAERLAAAHDAFGRGDSTKLTGVMCGSYHDVWMELHQDLLLALDVDRRE